METNDTPTTETPAAAETPAAEPVAAAAAAPEKSFEQEVAELAKQAATTAGGPPVEEEKPAEETPAEEKPEGEGEKPKEDPAEKPKEGGEAAEETKETKPAGDMARRLALVADGNRKNELRAKELDTREQQLAQKFKPLEDLTTRIRAVSTDRVAVVQEMLGGEEQLQDFYIELTERMSGEGGGEKKPARKPGDKPLTMDDVTRLVAEGVKSEIDKLGRGELERERAAFVAEARQALEADPSRFPLCFSAFPSDRAIAAISDAIETSTRRKPSVETVLQAIEDHRQGRHQKASKKADQTQPPTKKPAAATAPSKTSGVTPKPAIRGNDVPIVKQAPKSFDDEIAELADQVNRQAQA